MLVATPIGNLGDIGDRARRELVDADVVACEDTRRAGRLFQLLGLVPPPLVRLDAHTESSRADGLVERAQRGERVVVVTDAGSPGISDPGERLVAAAVAAGVAVIVVPGPAALIAALTGSGLATGRFCFEGFLPRRGSARRVLLDALATESRTVVLYESPHRLAATLAELAGSLGAERRVVVARELTKWHEEWWRGALADGAAWAAGVTVRGEVVVVIEGAAPPPPLDPEDLAAAVDAELAAGRSVRDVSQIVALRFGISRRAVYELALSRGKGEPGGAPQRERPR